MNEPTESEDSSAEWEELKVRLSTAGAPTQIAIARARLREYAQARGREWMLTNHEELGQLLPDFSPSMQELQFYSGSLFRKKQVDLSLCDQFVKFLISGISD